jgi:hypothetical protein
MSASIAIQNPAKPIAVHGVWKFIPKMPTTAPMITVKRWINWLVHSAQQDIEEIKFAAEQVPDVLDFIDGSLITALKRLK